MSKHMAVQNKHMAFWIELVLSVTAMAVCGCICLAVFLTADSISRASRNQAQAVLAAQNAAEEWKVRAASGDVKEGTETVYFDADWNPVENPETPEQAPFLLTSEIGVWNGMAVAEISVTEQTGQKEGGKTLIALTAQKFVPALVREGGAGT